MFAIYSRQQNTQLFLCLQNIVIYKRTEKKANRDLMWPTVVQVYYRLNRALL